MRRLLALCAAASLVPVVAWTAASAGPEPPVDCTPPTTTADAGCVAPAPAPAVEPVDETSTTSPTTPPTTPTTAPAPSTTSATSTPPSLEPSTTTAPSTGDSSTTTSIDPNTTAPSTSEPTTPETTTTTAPDPTSETTSTSIDPNATTTTATVDPNAAATTVPAPPEDLESDPVEPAVEAPGGRVVMPAGAVESGQLRPITFPVAGPVTYVNDWGACRDGCTRAHKGNDLIGDRLQPILAMHDGVVDHLVDHPTAGYGVAIRDDDGWQYHVYHMNNDTPESDDGADGGEWRFAPGIVAGARVTAGQLLGWMGDSGNSEGSVPHAHVEIHTPSGVAINPYWSLRSAQRARNCMVATVGQPTLLTSAAQQTDEVQPQPAADPATAGLAAPSPAAGPPASAAAPPALAATTVSAAASADPAWLVDGWWQAPLPAGWRPLGVTGGHPGSGDVGARFWISRTGFTPVDAAAVRVGDRRYDEGVDCAAGSDVVAPIPVELSRILATIRHMESGGNYTVSVTTSTASGAYGFLDSSWGGYGGFARAKDAPPEVQDARAAEWATAILNRNGGDVSTVPVSWYIGHVPIGDEWDRVPRPDAGNRITPREYQRRWLNWYEQLLGNPGLVNLTGALPSQTVDTSATCYTVLVDVGTAGHSQFVPTQAQSFLAAPDGRAVPNASDPCDPGRALSAAPPADAGLGGSGGEAVAKLEQPPTLTNRPR